MVSLIPRGEHREEGQTFTPSELDSGTWFASVSAAGAVVVWRDKQPESSCGRFEAFSSGMAGACGSAPWCFTSVQRMFTLSSDGAHGSARGG